MHYWDVRQRYDETKKKWLGNLDLTLFMGKNRMRITYHDKTDKFTLYKTDFEDPDLLYEFLNEICNLLDITKETIIKRSEPGDWIIKSNKVLYAPKVGFLIKSTRMTHPPYFIETKLSIQEDMTTLRDNWGYKLYASQTGLYNCHYEANTLPDFQSYGVSFQKMLKEGVFNRNFDISVKQKDTLRNLLDDIKVERPTVSSVTKQRLNLSENWIISDEKEEQVVEVQSETKQASEINYYEEFMKISEEEIKDIGVKWDFDPLMTFIEEFKSTDFFNTTNVVYEINYPRQVFNTIRSLKYDCISLLITDKGSINKTTIDNLNNILESGRQAVIYSLISRYDRLVANRSGESPHMVLILLDDRLKDLGVWYQTSRPLD